jgi:hypothetical protein
MNRNHSRYFSPSKRKIYKQSNFEIFKFTKTLFPYTLDLKNNMKKLSLGRKTWKLQQQQNQMTNQ